MFPRRSRLARADFSEALPRGARFSTLHFSAVAPRGVEGYAIVIPKRSARLSVTRHLLKRRVASALRALPLPKSLVVFVKPGADKLTFRDVASELATLVAHAPR